MGIASYSVALRGILTNLIRARQLINMDLLRVEEKFLIVIIQDGNAREFF